MCKLHCFFEAPQPSFAHSSKSHCNTKYFSMTQKSLSLEIRSQNISKLLFILPFNFILYHLISIERFMWHCSVQLHSIWTPQQSIIYDIEWAINNSHVYSIMNESNNGRLCDFRKNHCTEKLIKFLHLFACKSIVLEINAFCDKFQLEIKFPQFPSTILKLMMSRKGIWKILWFKYQSE